jgi:DNA-binding response OmpR family regulator
MPRVLVVDDEAPLRDLVGWYLAKERIEFRAAESGEEALVVLASEHVDVVVLDVMLPGVDGFEVLRQIRRRSDVPVILLTARGEEVRRVAGLELGADDYVVKPFSTAELVARVRVQLRRRGADPAPELRVGRVTIDRRARRCLAGSAPVALTRREFDLLVALALHAGHVLSRCDLLSEAWGTTFLSPKTVDVHVGALRRKLRGAVRITTLRGVGYRLETA